VLSGFRRGLRPPPPRAAERAPGGAAVGHHRDRGRSSVDGTRARPPETWPA